MRTSHREIPSGGSRLSVSTDLEMGTPQEEEAPFRVPFSITSSGHAVCNLCEHEFPRTDDLKFHVKFHERQGTNMLLSHFMRIA